MTKTQNSTHGHMLVTQLAEATSALIALVAPCSEAQWRASVPNEERSVGTMVHHIATNAPIVAGWAKQIGTGESPPSITMEIVHADNARHAAEHVSPDKAETIALLQYNTAAAAAIIRELSNEQLERSAPLALFGGQPTSARLIIEMVLIGHIRGYPHSHMPNIQTALAL